MLHRVIKFLIDNKLVAFLLLALLVLWGISTAPFDWDLGALPQDKVAVDAIPDIGENQQIVFTRWPGQSPQDIDDQITYPLTTALLGIPGVKTIRSTSMFGFSSIYVIFEEHVDFYWSRSRILEKLNALPRGLLPEGVQPTLGPDATGLGQIFWYTLEGRDENGKVTGGWDLHELRSIQDYFVKYALSSVDGVSEVASIGGFVKEYHIEPDPGKMKEYGISIGQIAGAVRKTNRETGAKTLEINNVEYFVRGLGYVKSLKDLENTVILTENSIPVLLKDVAKIQAGPAERRGILDKEGAEVVGGVVVARYGANPMEVIKNVKRKIEEIAPGLPEKKLADGRISKLTVVPFYDRTELIQKTLHTLNEALMLEILITILVIVLMMFNLRASLLISGLLPVAVLSVFIAMRYFGVDANIVALSGIAIAIGTMVDVGVILTENIIRHLKEFSGKRSVDEIIYNATVEVSGAIVTAVSTTIVSFLPVFTLTGAEGKLFRPLAFTKTMALVASLIVALFLIPPLAALLFRKRNAGRIFGGAANILLILAGVYSGLTYTALGWILVLAGSLNLYFMYARTPFVRYKKYVYPVLAVIAVLWLLADQWHPLGVDKFLGWNLLFVALVSLGLLGIFSVFKRYYTRMLSWALQNKWLFLSIPVSIFIAGFFSMKSLGKEFMPSLNEGSFLLMPTTMPHAGVSENKRMLQLLDMAVAQIPEVTTVVGKAGRVESALDPAPLSMFENIINYAPEFITDKKGEVLTFQTEDDGLFVTRDGFLVADGSFSPEEKKELKEKYGEKYIDYFDRKNVAESLIPDDDGKAFRLWRYRIRSADDIWNEIVKVSQFPGLTTAPKLQPIETRLIMLQTGMRAPMGIKIKGTDLDTIQAFGYALEKILKSVDGVKKDAVFADRIVGKPYLLIVPDRNKLARYGLQIADVQQHIEMAAGGKVVSQTVEGRERYAIKIRYPRELRDSPGRIGNILIHTPQGIQIPLKDVAEVTYRQGPQMIKSEDTFLTGYVLFDKTSGEAETDVVERARKAVLQAIESGELRVPEGITFSFTGNYENQIRAEKTLSIVIPVALIIIFLILYFQFRSVAVSLMVFSGIALAFAGGFILLWFYGQDWFMNWDIFGMNVRDIFNIRQVNLSVAVWVGFIALFGIATDDGVVMATYLTQVFHKNQPADTGAIHQSVIEAGKKRIRPCLMTTATTILALLPVLMSKGHGSDIMIPMAIPAFGGMLIALVTLFVVPVLFAMYKERQIKKLRR
jgi:Cu(I)/Ag(I) efflux system membrane protein CusA/SilA